MVAMEQFRDYKPDTASEATYQIKVLGKLDKRWSDWFDGTMITVERNLLGKQLTTLNCRVKDQSELHGMINQLFRLNLHLVSVELSQMNLDDDGV
ncbi:MAG: hypothetical protein PVF74_02630 [Anaerolineales bacterium]|jgi:hypothetical protein